MANGTMSFETASAVLLAINNFSASQTGLKLYASSVNGGDTGLIDSAIIQFNAPALVGGKATRQLTSAIEIVIPASTTVASVVLKSVGTTEKKIGHQDITPISFALSAKLKITSGYLQIDGGQ